MLCYHNPGLAPWNALQNSLKGIGSQPSWSSVTVSLRVFALSLAAVWWPPCLRNQFAATGEEEEEKREREGNEKDDKVS